MVSKTRLKGLLQRVTRSMQYSVQINECKSIEFSFTLPRCMVWESCGLRDIKACSRAINNKLRSSLWLQQYSISVCKQGNTVVCCFTDHPTEDREQSLCKGLSWKWWYGAASYVKNAKVSLNRRRVTFTWASACVELIIAISKQQPSAQVRSSLFRCLTDSTSICVHIGRRLDQHWAVRLKLNWAVLIHAQPFSWLRGHLLCERTSWNTVTSFTFRSV